MCRIAGIIFRGREEQFPEKKLSLQRASAMLAHGGPDDDGSFVSSENNIIFTHRRLSILDLSENGHQPMLSSDKKIVLSYNGEIYNFREIRAELKKLGFHFASESDTEVILKAYEAWGEKAFEKFNGMFAFSLFDEHRSLVFLVRDSGGIKPLYYGIDKDGSLYFSSEVRAFPVFNEHWPEDPSWRTHLLLFGHIPEPYTTLKNVQSLPKGHFLKYDLKIRSYNIEKYDEFVFTETIKSESEALQMIRKAMFGAVERQLVSDAPLGVFLSGGIDSSLISLIANEYRKGQLTTLSINFNEPHYSEKYYQTIIQEKIHSQHYYYTVTKDDFIRYFNDILSAMDQPTTDGINTYLVSKLAKERGLKVVLSGLGADEIFGGYPSFSNIEKVMPLYKLPPFLKKAFASFDLLHNDKIKKISFLQTPDPIALYLLFRGLFSLTSTAKILDIDETEVRRTLENVYIKDHMQKNLQPKNQASWMETNLYMQNQLLKDTDVMSMWNSLETRVPFLDRELRRVICSIDPQIKFKSTLPKYLLCKSFEDILPSEIVHRKKQGFTFPFKEWMQAYSSDILAKIGTQPNKHTQGLIADFKQGKLGWARFWSLILTHW